MSTTTTADTPPPPDRIIIYLAPPAKSANPASIIPARYAVRTVLNGEEISRSDFAGQGLGANETMIFTLTAEEGHIPVDLLGIGWIGGCGFYGSVLLGSNGSEASKRLGIKYAPSGIEPCKVLKCTYHGTGELICQDHMGISFQAFLPRSYSEGLCITLTVKPGTAARVEYAADVCVQHAL